MKTNVLIADGRKIVREGLSLLLDRDERTKVVGEASDVPGAVKLIRSLPAHVVVLNLATPVGGFEAVRTLVAARRTRPVKILVFMMTPDAGLVQVLLDAGASGCLSKEAAAGELIEAIGCVRAGGTYLCKALLDLVVAGYVRRRQDSKAERPLSQRERDVLERIASGNSTKEIAAALQVSTKTVETLRRRLMQKLDRHSVAELTKYAVLKGISGLERVR